MAEITERPAGLPTKVDTCTECGHALTEDVCVNPDCTEAQKTASAAAERETAKATAATGVTEVTRADPSASERPRSFARTGSYD